MRITYVWIVTAVVKEVYVLGNSTDTAHEPTQPNDAYFVEIIKKNLRQNNDDYTDTNNARHTKDNNTIGNNNAVPKGAVVGTNSAHAQSEAKQISYDIRIRKQNSDDIVFENVRKFKQNNNDNKTINNKSYRRRFGKKVTLTHEPPKLHKSQEINMLLPKIGQFQPMLHNKSLMHYKLRKSKVTPVATSANIASPRLVKHHSASLYQKRQISTIIPTVTFSVKTPNIHKTKPNKNKVQQFRHFMKKNRELFKGFINKKYSDVVASTRTIRMKAVDHANRIKEIFFGRTKGIARSLAKGVADLPDGHLLDMAPAKGGRVNLQRIAVPRKRSRGQQFNSSFKYPRFVHKEDRHGQGRLCHRHVLLPEGPKYDSKGRWYLAAHEFVLARPYDATRRPEMLLPRCCNCCKKSVLGCE